MNFYKITNESENHRGMKYKTGLNVDILPFNPSGDCEPGGIYFAREDILAFLYYGHWIRKVTLPEDAQIYENIGEQKKWKADKIILGKPKRITAKVVERLIKEGADINADHGCALHWASENGHTEIVKLLLENGADIHADGDCALWLASSNGHTEVVKLLLEKGADIHADNDCALHWASKYRHTKIVKLLKKAMENETKNI
jgi:hypothetical protein